MGTGIIELLFWEPIPNSPSMQFDAGFFLSPFFVPLFSFLVLFDHWMIWVPFLGAFILFSLTAIASTGIGKGVLIYSGFLSFCASGVMSMLAIASY